MKAHKAREKTRARKSRKKMKASKAHKKNGGTLKDEST